MVILDQDRELLIEADAVAIGVRQDQFLLIAYKRDGHDRYIGKFKSRENTNIAFEKILIGVKKGERVISVMSDAAAEHICRDIPVEKREDALWSLS